MATTEATVVKESSWQPDWVNQLNPDAAELEAKRQAAMDAVQERIKQNPMGSFYNAEAADICGCEEGGDCGCGEWELYITIKVGDRYLSVELNSDQVYDIYHEAERAGMV